MNSQITEATSLFAFTADCHLLPNAWINRREIRGDSYFSFKQIVNHCLVRNIPLVIGGDLFDSKRPDSESVAVFIHETRRMRDSHLPVYVVQGDHDITDPPWPVAISPDAVFHLHDQLVKLQDVTLTGLDYQPRGQLQERLRGIPVEADILVMHQGWQEFQGIGTTEGSLATDIPQGIYVLTGDYHAEKIYGTETQAVVAISPGSTCMQALGEPAEKSFVEVRRCSDGRIEFKRVPLVTRMVRSFEIGSPEELHHLITVTFPALHTQAMLRAQEFPVPLDIISPIIRVRYKDDIPEAGKLLKEAATDTLHLFLEPQHAVDEIYVPFEQSPNGAFESLLGACRQLSPSEDDFNMIQRLLRTDEGSRGLELEAMRQEFMNASDSPRSDGVVPAQPQGG